MTKLINVNNVLYFYDGIQVFDATDGIGGHYIGLFVEDLPNGEWRFLVVGTFPESLQRFRMGEVDLRSLIEKRAEQDWFMVEAANDLGEHLPLLAQSGPIPEAYLPEADFVLQNTQLVTRCAAVRGEALARRNVVLN